MDIIEVILTIVTLITAGLSLFIVRGEKKESNNVFSLFILSISLWAFGLLMFRITDSLENALVYSRFYYIAAAAIPTFFLMFSYTFPNRDTLSVFKKVLIYSPLVLFTFFIIIDQHFILKDVYLLDGITKSAHINVFNYIVYTVYFISFLVVAYLRLFKAYINSKDPLVRTQLSFIFIGTIIPYLIAMYFDLISPLFDYTHIWVGPLMTIVVVWSLLYAVYRHHLLNARVITTELFTACLWIFILTRVLLSDNLQDKLLNLGLLVLTIVVGLFLIRSVHREISQREHIEALATDLEKANVRLTELDRQKSEFVSFATHQLRAPLTAMKGYASLILEGDMGTITDETREGLSRIFDSTKTLTNIVDDYLNITRIELGSMKYAFETISLKALIEDAIAELKPNIDKSKLDFSFTVDMPDAAYRITADRDKLKQVINNLIDNSIKYTPSGFVKVSLAMDRARHLFVFKLQDSGIGISAETIPLLFQKFSRAHDANKVNIKGTGLGLFVAKEIITAHHGNIRVESPGEGKGSTFTVELEPFAKA